MVNNKKKPRKKANRPARRPRNRNRGAGPLIETVHTAPCTRHYMSALASPFTMVGKEKPCVIDTVALPSYKCETLQRFGMKPSTTDYVSVAINSDYIFNDSGGGWLARTTGPSSVFSAGSSTPSTITNPVEKMCNGSPFTYANYTAGDVSFRVVACGLRVTYIGPPLDRTGVLYAARSQANMDNNLTCDELQALPTTICYPIGDRPIVIPWLPAGLGDQAYKTYGSDNADVNDTTMFIWGAVNSTALFHVEVVHFIEAISRLTPTVTPSHTDLPGQSAILDVVNSMPSSHVEQTPGDKSYLTSFYEGFKRAFVASQSHISETTLHRAAQMGGAALTGYMTNRYARNRLQ